MHGPLHAEEEVTHMIGTTILKKKIYHKLHLDSDKVVESFLTKHFHQVIDTYKNIPNPSTTEERKKAPIFVCWWQGEENAPEIVRICIASIKRNAQDHPVVLITKSNWNEWTDIPDYILRKVESKQISFTHFSDILRMALLARHGGLWLDATMFVANPISETIFSKPYWTIHREVANSITRGRWTGYCQAGQPNAFIHSFCRDFFYAYWTKYDKLVDYFLIDYVMDIGYRNLPHMQQLIDSVSPSNQKVLDLDRSFHLVYEQEAYRELVCSQTFFKLNWKRTYATDADGMVTMYQHFLDEQRSFLT